MNDGTDNHNEPAQEAPLRPWIEPELEARLTALVLGEASDFEREELEREISARPELGAYRNRLEAMHSLLSEVGKGEATENDEEWKLSGERRATLLESIGGPDSEEAPAETTQTRSAMVGEAPKRNWVAPFLKIAASLMVATGLALFGFFQLAENEHVASSSYGRPGEEGEEAGNRIYVDSFSVSAGEDTFFPATETSTEDLTSAEVTQLSVIPEARTSVPMPNKPDEGNVHSLFGQQRKPSAPMPEQKVDDDLMVLSSIDDLQDEVESKGNVTVTAGGQITVLGKGLEFSNRSDLIASAGSGGAVRIGGGFQGQDPSLEKIESVEWQDAGAAGVSGNGGYVEMDSNGIVNTGTIKASASSGDGGEIVVGEGVVGDISMGRQVGDITSDEVPELASRYVTRLQERVNKANEAATRGEQLMADGDLEGAVTEFTAANHLMPDAPAAQESAAEHTNKLAAASTRLARQKADEAKYDEAKTLLENVLAPDVDPNNREARKLLDQINDPEYYSPALTPEHHADQKMSVDQALRTAEGYAEIGDYDKAQAEYFKALNADPYNSAARRGMEEVDQERLDYYETARNQTRAEFIKRVEQYWELPVSGAETPKVNPDIRVGGATLGPPMAGGDIDRDLGRFYEAQHEWLNYPGQEGNTKREADQIQWSNDRASSDAFAVGSIIAGKNVGTSGGGSLNLISGWDDQNDNAVAEILALTPQVVGGGSVEAESEELLERRQKQFAGIGHGGSSIGLDFINPRIEGEQSNAPNVAGHGQVTPITAGSMVMPLDEAEMPLGIVGSRFGDLTVSLSAAPEVVSFDGFINHGFPVLASVPNGLDETAATEEAFSTFSLHISDVSFQLAQASLAKGEWPDRERIRIEEFVNAFDYGDPMPGQDDKVACRVEQAAHPFFQQRNLLRVSLRTAEAGRSANTPLRLTLLLDNSGSMERSDRQETVKRAFATLASQLQENDQVSLISFARQPRLVADAIAGPEANALVETVSTLPSEGGTNLEAALQLATEKAREHQLEGAQNRIVLLTDGAANLGDADPETLSRLIESLRESGIAFDAAGIGADGLNDEILEALTRKGDGRYYLLDQPEDAEDGFAKQIAGALRPAAKNVKVQVEFNPDRVGRYKLLGFEKHRLEKEDFRDDKVDAAEMAAAEAGVAVYQVEPLSEGEGNLGAISVRFRDLDSGEMVEKRWPIPYLPSAPAAGQAGDSMQLATVVAQFAAKLKGGPLGDVVDLDELARLAGALPDHLQKLERVRQLREMVEQARSLEGNG